MKRLLGLVIVACLLASASPASGGLRELLGIRPATHRTFKQKSNAQTSKPTTPVFRTVSARVVPGKPASLVKQVEEVNLQVPPAPSGGDGTELEPLPEPGAIGDGVETIELYPWVCYRDHHSIHPCAVRKVVAVKDPTCCADPCSCCPLEFVYVEVCMPPGHCPKYEIKRRDHSKIEYDYGWYEVEITSRNGVVYVDYDG